MPSYLLDISCAANSAAGSSGDLSRVLEQPVEQEQVELRCFKPKDVPRYLNNKIGQVLESAISKKPIPVEKINNSINGNKIFFTIVDNDYTRQN